MLDNPLLIRRPLIDVGEARCAGLDREPVLALLGPEMQDELNRMFTRSRPHALPAKVKAMSLDHTRQQMTFSNFGFSMGAVRGQPSRSWPARVATQQDGPGHCP